VLWKADLSGGYSSIAVAGGRVFTHTARHKKQEIVYCWDAASGKELWRHAYACDYDRHLTLIEGADNGPRATPAVDGDRVYTIGTTGIVLCLDAATGKKLWQAELLKLGRRKCPPRGYCSSPLVVGNHVYVHPAGRQSNSLAALDKNTGAILWTALDDPQGFATPIWIESHGLSQLVHFTATGVVCVAPDTGRLLWRYSWNTSPNGHAATPIFIDDKVFISSGNGLGGALFRVPENGTPETVWKTRAMQNEYATSVFYEGYLYGFSVARLRCLDIATGQPKWDRADLGKGTLLVADHHLIILTEAGDLVLAEATPKGYREKSRCKPLEGVCLSAPVFSGGRLFIRSEQMIVALDLREKP
jgi:outer membrane protein assembly factor BamB